MTNIQQKSQQIIREWGAFLIIAMLLLAAPLYLSDFRLNLLGKFLTYAIASMGLILLWGYGGMLSLGQGLFFGIGAYALAMYLKLESAKGRLPDFMVWSGLTELPIFWKPFVSPVFAIAAVILLPALIAGTFGFFIFRSRIQGVYFSIITQALTLLVSILLIGQQPFTGGTNGLTNLSTIFGYSLANQQTKTVLYMITAVVLIVVYLLCWLLARSRFGRLLIAMRDDEARVRFLGYNPAILKTLTFVIAAMIMGIAGALYVPQVGIISPSTMGVLFSIEMVIWVAVGGRDKLLGAIIGAIVVNWGRSLISENYPDIWQVFLGGLFIFVVLVFPKGIVGTIQGAVPKVREWLAKRRTPAPVAADS